MNAAHRDTTPLRVAVAMLGARRHYAVPRLLHEAGLLDTFFTDIDSGAPWLRLARALLPAAVQGDALARLFGREAPDIPRDKIRSFAWFGLGRALRNRAATTPALRLRAYLQWNREFGLRVRDRWPDSANAAYAFNGAALELFERARSRGARCILDQTAAPWAVEESMLAEERGRWPGWEFEGAARTDWEPMAERERREWDLADVIVCGSDYVRESIRAIGGPAGKCAVVPYGVAAGAIRPRVRESGGRPLNVLFVGTLQLRKGIQYVMEAARLLNRADVAVRAVGAARISDDAAKEIGRVVERIGAVPRSDVPAHYEWADVLVAPSISEGSANVCYEALAAGLPVIATPNTGSVVRDGVDGFLVPIRSSQDLADRIGRLAADRALLTRLSKNAIERAAEFTWTKYGERLVAAVAP